MTTTDITTNTPHPWERQGGETDRAWEAFKIYRELGAGRSMGEVARRLGKHEQQIHRWGARYLWADRILQLDQYMDRQWTNALAGERLATTQRQLRTVRAAAGIGVQWMQDVKRKLEAGQKVNDVVLVRLLLGSMAAERELLGIGEDRSQDDGTIEVVMVDARMFPGAPPGALDVVIDDDGADSNP